MVELLKSAADNGGRNFNIFLNNADSKCLPRRNPRPMQMEIKSKIPNFSKIDNVSDVQDQEVGFLALQM